MRFDGPRAYAITYNQTDPMFVIDLSDPRAPRQRGALYMPGFMFYLEPYGASLGSLRRALPLAIKDLFLHGSRAKRCRPSANRLIPADPMP